MSDYFRTMGYVVDRDEPGITFKDGYAFVDAYTSYNTRTKAESPYGYGCHIIKGPIKYLEGKEALYDDRIRQWDREAWDKALDAKLLPKGWNRFKEASLAKTSEFISIALKRKVKVLQVCEGCNVSNGYPYYIFVLENVDDSKGNQ